MGSFPGSSRRVSAGLAASQLPGRCISWLIKTPPVLTMECMPVSSPVACCFEFRHVSIILRPTTTTTLCAPSYSPATDLQGSAHRTWQPTRSCQSEATATAQVADTPQLAGQLLRYDTTRITAPIPADHPRCSLPTGRDWLMQDAKATESQSLAYTVSKACVYEIHNPHQPSETPMLDTPPSNHPQNGVLPKRVFDSSRKKKHTPHHAHNEALCNP